MNDEQLESLLRQSAESESPPPEPSVELTVNVMSTVARRQTRRRRALMASTIAGAYVAGLLTMWFGAPPGVVEQSEPEQQIASQEDTSPPPEAPVPETLPIEAPAPQVEEQAPGAVVVETPNPERSVYQLFRELGDTSHARGDVTSSVRYYRLALDAATEQELRSAEASDNLLLLSLKQDRMAAIELTKQEESL